MQLQEQEQAQSLEYFTQLANLLRAQGVPEEEIRRAILSQYENPTPAAQPFPGPITGIDLAGNQPRFLVPDTGFPPVFSQNPIESTDFIPSVGPEGYLSLPTPDPLGSVKTNNPRYSANGSNLGHSYNIINSPVEPSVNWLGMASDVTSEPPTIGVRGYNFDMEVPPWRYDVEQSQSMPVNLPPIAIFPSGASREIRESIGKVNATWIAPDYIAAAKESAERNGAKLYLIKAAEETVTDHRSEGEPYLRKLAATELQKMVRTAISKGTDINHLGPEYRTGGVIVDGEWDPNMQEMQYLVIESDAEINAAISRGDIDAVSINGGSPRKEVVEPCDHNCNGGACELCTVPVGVILAELDDIGFTWVAAKPFMWRGNMIEPATPGIKTTVIQPL